MIKFVRIFTPWWTILKHIHDSEHLSPCSFMYPNNIYNVCKKS